MNFLRRFSPFEVVLVAIILGVHLHAALSDAYNFPNFWFKRDDAFYYFKVAQNIAEGRGSTFDGIHPTNGYHPLWLVVCIPIFALARFDVILPLRVLLMVIAAMQAVTAVLMYRLVRDNLSRAVGIAAASFWAFSFYIHYAVYEFGLETPIAALAVVLLLYKLSRFEMEWRAGGIPMRQIAALALIATLAMFSRLDLVFLAIITGAWVIFRGKPIRHLLPLDLVILFASMTGSVALRTGFPAYNEHYSSSAIQATLLAMIVTVIALYGFGAYRHPRASSVWGAFRQLLCAVTVGTITTAILHIVLSQFGFGTNFPRTAFLLYWIVSLTLLSTLRLAAGWFASPEFISADSPVDEFKSNWKTWLVEGATYYGILGGFLAAYMGFNKVVFGTSSPVSGQVKRWWGSMPVTLYEGPASNWFSFFGIGRDHFNAWQPLTDLFYWAAEFLRPLRPGAGAAATDRYYIAMALFAGLSIAVLFISKRRAANALTNMAVVPLAAGIGVHILSYSTTSYGGAKEWYWVSQMLMIVLAASLLVHLALKPLRRGRAARIALEVSAILFGAYMGYNISRVIISVMVHDYFPSDRAYMEVVEFLEENTPPGSVIGMTGGGNVGYFIQDRTIVNMDGLINSHEYFIALQTGDAAPYLYERGMTIVFANPRLLVMPPYHAQFAPYFQKFGNFGGKDLLYLLPEPKY